MWRIMSVLCPWFQCLLQHNQAWEFPASKLEPVLVCKTLRKFYVIQPVFRCSCSIYALFQLFVPWPDFSIKVCSHACIMYLSYNRRWCYHRNQWMMCYMYAIWPWKWMFMMHLILNHLSADPVNIWVKSFPLCGPRIFTGKHQKTHHFVSLATHSFTCSIGKTAYQN